MKTLAVTLALVLALAFGPSARTADARPELVPVDTDHPHLRVVAEPGLERVARTLADEADAALDDISTDLPGLPPPGPITLQVVRDASDLASIAPEGRGAPDYAIGVAYPDLGVISVAMNRKGEPADPTPTLRHELGHIALGAAMGREVGAHIPRWLHEGFANQHAGELGMERIETLAGMAWLGGIIPYDRLDASIADLGPGGEMQTSHAYAESFDFVRFLARRGRYEDTDDDGDRWPYRRFLRGLAHGQTVDAAAREAFGKPIHGLFEEWKAELDRGYLWAPAGVLGLAVWVLCALLLMLGWARRRRQNRVRMARWERDEAPPREAGAGTGSGTVELVEPPPYVAWPGEDPLAEDDEDPPPPPRPRWIN